MEDNEDNIVIDYLACNGKGEILVMDIITMINKLIGKVRDIEDCCSQMRNKSFIRTYRSDNILYITDDGSDPHP
jgi:hypothetical protein